MAKDKYLEDLCGGGWSNRHEGQSQVGNVMINFLHRNKESSNCSTIDRNVHNKSVQVASSRISKQPRS